MALKLIKPGMDTEQILARFDMERETLALMDHPNIARVLDAGTTHQGRPYFVMELIHGVPITEYCDAHRVSIPHRLKMFVQVCRAVQHAHQKGIIHRDIKPLNVLATEEDGQPTPKIIDFGVAKALHQHLTDQSVYSGVFQAIGTVAYMSPEQAGLSSRDVDSRADVYGPGVLLYELLTGKTPFDKDDSASAALDEACRIIREQNPPKPSFTVSTMGERAIAISEVRGTDPANLGKLMRGELDWIVIKTLEKDRNRRYESASNLSDDINRYLAGEPVSVSPPSNVYRFTRFCRRNKGKMAATVLVAATLLICTAVAIALTINSNRLSEQNKEHVITLREREAQLIKKTDELQGKNESLERSQEAQAQVSYSLAMMSAYMEWANANPVVVERLLNKAQSYLESIESEPGVEWNLLWHQMRRDFADYAGITLSQTHPFVKFEFSPDSRWLAVPVRNSGIRVVDLLTYEQTQIDIPLMSSGKLSLPLSAAFSPNGDLLAFGVRMGPDVGQAIITDAKREIVQVVELGFEPWRLRFSSNGGQLKAGSAYPAPTITGEMAIVWTDESRELDASEPSLEKPANNSPNLAYLRSRRAIDPWMTIEAPLGVVRNSPTYDWHMTNIRNYVNLSPVAIPTKRITDLGLKPLGGGSEMIGLPGDFTPPSRFVRAVAFSQTARPTPDGPEMIYELFRILDNFNVPLASAEGSDDAQDVITERSATIWTTAHDTRNKVFYYHTQHNRRVRMIDIKKIHFDALGQEIMHFPLDKEERQDIEDVTPR